MKSPGFTFITVLTLAIGIGANTAIFSLINAYFLKPLPYEDAGRLVTIFNDTISGSDLRTQGKLVLDIEANSTQLESLVGVTGAGAKLTLTGIETPTKLQGIQVTGPFLKTLGLQPTRGQDFAAEHQSLTGDSNVILLSEEAWKKYMNSEPNPLGKSIVLNYQSYTIIGLYDEKPMEALIWWMPLEFMIPAALHKHPKKQKNWRFDTVGRLASTANINSANQEINAIKSQFSNTYPDYVRESEAVVKSLQEARFIHLKNLTTLLLSAVGAVLLIACVNVANLLFARATSRQSEIALRTAIGASGWRIVRLLLCESALLSLAGAAGGLLICLNALPLLSRLLVFSNWPEINLSIDLRVLGFTLAVSVGTGILFGVFPAFKALRQGSAKGLSDTSRSFTPFQGNRLQSSLIITEIALSVILLVSIGLLLKSSSNALNADRGFEEAHIFTFAVGKNADQRTEPAPEQAEQVLPRFPEQVIESLKRIPGVENAAMASQPPMDPRNGIWLQFFWRDDQADAEHTYQVPNLRITGDLLSILNIPLLRGRAFDEADHQKEAHRVALIDELLAKEKFPDVDPIGQTIHLNRGHFEIVGIVGSIVTKRLDRGQEPLVYTPHRTRSNTVYFIKTRLNQRELERRVQEAMKSIDPDQPIGKLVALEQTVKNTLNYRSALNILFALFGGIATFLAAIGIYGLMTYLVEQRHREIGIRLAIGALPQEIVGMVFKRGMVLASMGVGIGIIAILILGRFITFLTYQVTPYDPVILASVSLFIFLISAFACWHPARSAIKIHPTQALQHD